MSQSNGTYSRQAHYAILAAARAEHDFGGWLAAVLAAVAADLGASEALTAGRPGSWEADLVQQLVKGTVGWGRRVSPGLHEGFPMNDDPAFALLRAIADGLPDALDDETAAKLAARIRPYVTAPGSVRESTIECLLTVADVAAVAHVHAETVRRAIRAGRLIVAGRVGRSPRIHPLDVERWLADTSAANETISRSSAPRPRPSRRGNEYSLKAAFKTAQGDV